MTVPIYGTITWIPMLVFFLLSAGCFAWGHQWHFMGYILWVCIGLAIFELWCKMQTGHTLSQNFVIWKQGSWREYLLAWMSISFMMLAIFFLGHHLE
jgi:hypothetical protein